MAVAVGDFAHFQRGEVIPIGPAPAGDASGNFGRFVRVDPFGWFDATDADAGPQALLTFFERPVGVDVF